MKAWIFGAALVAAVAGAAPAWAETAAPPTVETLMSA